MSRGVADETATPHVQMVTGTAAGAIRACLALHLGRHGGPLGGGGDEVMECKYGTGSSRDEGEGGGTWSVRLRQRYILGVIMFGPAVRQGRGQSGAAGVRSEVRGGVR
jgi:hypothetical protein